MTINLNIIKSAAIITLNRPHRYNAIDLEMASELLSLLNGVVKNDAIKKVILTSTHPKAFCAGGDIRIAYEAIKKQDFSYGTTFFEKEYKLVYDLANCPKPVISLVNGLCFGGGMGLTMHNRIRIVTENAVLGMPETIIGFFPDVGSSYRFSHFPKAWANFYGMTGNNIALKHALDWNMFDYYVPSTFLPELIENLCTFENDHQTIAKFSYPVPNQPTYDETMINNVFEKPLEEIFEALQTDDSSEAKNILTDLKARSPLSLMVTDKLLSMSKFLDLKKSLELDRVLASNFIFNPDLQEGIRAQLIDKDRKPDWHYKMPSINDEVVRDFFVPTYSDVERQPTNSND